MITGDVSNTRRQESIDEFTKAQTGSCLVSQITAGGVGLNIKAANIVILCDHNGKLQQKNKLLVVLIAWDSQETCLSTDYSQKIVLIDLSMLEVLGEKANLFDLYTRESQVIDRALSEQEVAEEQSIQQKVLEIEQERLKQEGS